MIESAKRRRSFANATIRKYRCKSISGWQIANFATSVWWWSFRPQAIAGLATNADLNSGGTTAPNTRCTAQ
ncbi:hypothetical protein Mycsm_06075 [Mycobacterium sp. JS623]|nr:hypothetical protein Mycsm_06075 [Mycobacterium sp. JS623]